MSFLSLATAFAIVIGIASGVPQLATMLRARSAAGQSPLGWTLGIAVNSLMAYVNFVGYGAVLLAAGSVTSTALCVTALGLVLRFRDVAPAHAPADLELVAVPAPVPAPAPTFADLGTGEFWALREQLEHEARRRAPELVAA